MKLKFRLIPLLFIFMLAIGCAKDRKPNLRDDKLQSSTTVSDGSVSGTTTVQGETTTNNDVYIVEFEANTLDGKPFTSECFANSRLTMINVWATYCNPCLSEMPYLGELAVEYDAAEFQVIGVVCDVLESSSKSTIEYAKDLVEQTKATTYTHLLLNDSLVQSLVGAVTSVPTTFFVNQKGELLGYIEGSYHKEVWEGVINELLADVE